MEKNEKYNNEYDSEHEEEKTPHEDLVHSK
jgi:hypothetical protein